MPSQGKHIPKMMLLFFWRKTMRCPALAYLEECQRLGAKTEQLEGVKRLIKRVEDWRTAHPDLCKVPDVEPGPEADRILGE